MITSYAVSPQAVFTCPPCSIRRRPQGTNCARRLTYFSTTDPKPKLHCFIESSSIDPVKQKQFFHSTCDIKDPTGPIVHLETLTTHNEETALNNKLLAIHDNGEIRCFTEDLGLEEWKANITPGSTLSVERALVLSFEEATQSVLKNHEDVLALCGREEVTSDSSLLFLITRTTSSARSDWGSTLCLRLFLIRVAKSARRPLEELISLSLPEPRVFKAEKSTYLWHRSNGTILQRSSSAVAVYDVHSLVPQLMHHMPLRSGKIVGCLRLSPFLIAINTLVSIYIVDLQYSSIQAKQALEPVPRTINQAVKQNYTPKNKGGTHLLSYFAALDLIVALQDRKLVAFQLSTETGQGSWTRKRKRGGLLVNSIGLETVPVKERLSMSRALRGIPKPLGIRLPDSRTVDDWNSMEEKLESLFVGNYFTQFEILMASELGITNGADETEVRTMLSVDTDLRKIYYLLNKVFTIEQTQQAEGQNSVQRKLKVSWFSDTLCHWMIRHGLFSVNHIEASLKLQGCIEATEHLVVGAYTQAVVEWDRSLKILELILTNPVRIDAREIVHALRHLMGLLNVFEPVNEVEVPTNGNVLNEGRPDQSMDLKTALLRNENQNIAHALECILIRLNTFKTSKITQALKSELSAQDLRSLVDVLRTALAQGLWLLPYVEDNLEPLRNDKSDNGQISIIAKLLNCVIDSIGTGGWILGSSSTHDLSETADTIVCMKAEISAALEGIEEATYLRGLLGEILLYGKNSTTSQPNHFGVLGANQQSAKIQSITTGGAGIESSALPLGLKAIQKVSTTRVIAGGVLQQRSQRDIKRLQSKMVGKYSFDQITI